MFSALLCLGLASSGAAQQQAAPSATAGQQHVDGLHPELRARLTAFAVEARAAGEPIKYISGYRRLDTARARAGRASWHNFGLAIDFNLTEYASMQAALSHYRQDRSRWARIGRIAERHGLIWGGHWGPEEIFHVEWHPGMPARLAGPALRSLLAEAGADGRRYRETWHRFAASPRPPADPVLKARKTSRHPKGHSHRKRQKRSRRPKRRS